MTTDGFKGLKGLDCKAIILDTSTETETHTTGMCSGDLQVHVMMCAATSTSLFSTSLNTEQGFNNIFLNMCQNLQNTDWTNFNEGRRDEAFTNFTENLDAIVKTFAPIIKKNISPKNVKRQPCVTKGLITSAHKKENLFEHCHHKEKNTSFLLEISGLQSTL